CDGDIVVLRDPDARIKAFASHGAVRSCAGCRSASSGSGVSRDRHGGRAIPLRTGPESASSDRSPSFPALANDSLKA
ncbi:MAG: hypothetical protein OXC68_15295, partial [Aestuariivita sp.]|nr:hypothetical protein [Aestuariivita sp.]